LRNRKEIVFSETGDAECGYLMGIHCDATASKLGKSNTIAEMIDILKKETYLFTEDFDVCGFIFDADDETVMEYCNDTEAVNRALSFINQLNNIESISKIKKITIDGEEFGMNGEVFNLYTEYDMDSKEYIVKQEGEPFDKDGSEGGHIYVGQYNEYGMSDDSFTSSNLTYLYEFYNKSEEYEYIKNPEETPGKLVIAREVELSPRFEDSNVETEYPTNLNKYNKNIENVKIGDEVMIKPIAPNYFRYMGVYNDKGGLMGFFYIWNEIRGQISQDKILDSKVIYVEPLSKRRKGSKKARLFVEITLKM
jgi:hypothetical protein